MAKVALPDDPADCWLWTGFRRGRHEYGGFSLNDHNEFAHRVAYEMFVGPIPDGLSIDHTCYAKLCVNPKHLRLATVKQNNENIRSARRNSKSGVRGVRAGNGGWRVIVKHAGRPYYGGTHDSIAEAEAAAIELRNRLFTHNDADRVA